MQFTASHHAIELLHKKNKTAVYKLRIWLLVNLLIFIKTIWEISRKNCYIFVAAQHIDKRYCQYITLKNTGFCLTIACL
jgi:hypothetical protein